MRTGDQAEQSIATDNVPRSTTSNPTPTPGAVGTQDPEILKKFIEIEALIQQILGVPTPIKKSAPSCYADSLFVDEIALVEMPQKFSFPNMKLYNGTSDPDDHIAQYHQRMLRGMHV